MNIMIMGASGMIGQSLVEALRSSHTITVAGRTRAKLKNIFGNQYNIVTWNDLTAESLANYDIIINLAGANIGKKRWTSSQKQKIIDSRVKTTQILATYCAALSPKAPRLMNANAIGIYGLSPTIEAQNTTIYDEDSKLPTPATDFLSEVGQQWEDALLPAKEAGVAVVELRFAVVLSQKGGALAKMLPSFRMGLGTVLGSGKQSLSWVSLDDAVSAIAFLIEHQQATGVFNIVADEVVSQKQFAKTLAQILNRPCFLTLPSFLVTLLFGQMGYELLLNGQVVKAKRLRKLGFVFRFDKLKDALKNLLL